MAKECKAVLACLWTGGLMEFECWKQGSFDCVVKLWRWQHDTTSPAASLGTLAAGPCRNLASYCDVWLKVSNPGGKKLKVTLAPKQIKQWLSFVFKIKLCINHPVEGEITSFGEWCKTWLLYWRMSRFSETRSSISVVKGAVQKLTSKLGYLFHLVSIINGTVLGFVASHETGKHVRMIQQFAICINLVSLNSNKTSINVALNCYSSPWSSIKTTSQWPGDAGHRSHIPPWSAEHWLPGWCRWSNILRSAVEIPHVIHSQK